MFQDIEQLFDEINAKNNDSKYENKEDSKLDDVFSFKNDDNIKSLDIKDSKLNEEESIANADSLSSRTDINSRFKDSNDSLDKMFDNLTTDVTGATNFITKVINKKEELNKAQKNLLDEKNSFLIW